MVSVVISSHFRGGIFMVTPKSGGTQREVSLIKVFSCVTHIYILLIFSVVVVKPGAPRPAAGARLVS